MSKFLAAVALILSPASFIAFPQTQSTNDNPPSQGIAPKAINGIGRADVRVFDESGNPIRNAYVKLESTRSDGFFCESWGDTDERGIIALLPIHMGRLKLKIKAKDYHATTLDVPIDQLAQPVRVTLKKK